MSQEKPWAQIFDLFPQCVLNVSALTPKIPSAAAKSSGGDTSVACFSWPPVTPYCSAQSTPTRLVGHRPAALSKEAVVREVVPGLVGALALLEVGDPRVACGSGSLEVFKAVPVGRETSDLF